MFSGIVESCQPLLRTQFLDSGLLRLFIQRPVEFDDLKNGDSICCNGVCLTVEAWSQQEMEFTLGLETLKILDPKVNSQESILKSLKQDKSQFLWSHPGWINLERSLRLGDRIHGHLVTGHVEGLAQVLFCRDDKDGKFVELLLPPDLQVHVWKKGSITVNGVSLTINEFFDQKVQVYLIPETLKRTNLKDILQGQWVTVESDYFAKMAFQALKQRESGTYV